MKITVNGKNVELKDASTLSELIAEKKLDASKVLASVNNDIIQAGTFAEVVLNEDDAVELFSFVSGG